MFFRDALGRDVEMPHPPERIVSLVPSITEAMFAFGVGERVVGVTRFCVEPPEGVRDKPKVGGTKNVDAPAVVALQPDLVIANVEENTREDIERLIAAGLTVLVTYPRTVREAIDEMRTIAEVVDARNEAAPILVEAADELEAAEADVRSAVAVFCPIWRNPWMTIGPDTYVHDVLRVCGGENVYGDSAERYPRIELADVRARGPEVVLLPDEPYRFGEKHVPEVIENLGETRIFLVDGKRLCWYGPRIPESIRAVRRILRGDVGV